MCYSSGKRLAAIGASMGIAFFLNAMDVSAASNLLVSESANRSAPSTLDGQTFRGNIYVWTKSTSAVQSVRFYLDNVLKVTENSAPYDFAGSVSATQAKPFDTSRISAGGHTIMAKVLLTNGVTETVTGTFTRSATQTVGVVPDGGGGGSNVGKKWHPGHYVLAYENAGVGNLSKIAGDPNFQGISAWHYWREFEQAKGVYDFSEMVAELNAARAVNKRYLIKVMDKTFGARFAPCVPDYMLRDPIYKGGQTVVYNSNGTVKKCSVKRWVPAVQARLNALYAALGDRFDREPYFEGIQTSENALTLGTNSGDYSFQAYVDSWKSGMRALAAAFPTSQVFAMVNWTRAELDQLIPFAHSVGLGIGGPDLVPPVAGSATIGSYAYYPQYYGKMPLAIDAQLGNVSRHLASGILDIEDLYSFAITNPQGLRVNYLFWTIGESSTWSFTNDIKPMVARHRGYTNQSCPLNINCQ